MNNPTKHFHLYAIELQDGKYYIGKTSQADPERRIQQHMNGFYTAQWVRKYPYVRTIEIKDIGLVTSNESDEQENELTRVYMKQYGYQNVRGGKYNYSGKYYKFGNSFYTDTYVKFCLVMAFMTLCTLTLAAMAWNR